MSKYTIVIILFGALLSPKGSVKSAEYEPLKARVPVMERNVARQMVPPFGPTKNATQHIIAEGKRVYEGKGGCHTCHGKEGDGNGPAARQLNPSPRDFTNCQFQKRRSDGELFWVLHNGSPGTGMIPMIPVTINEEEAWKVIAYERSFCKKRRR